MAFCCGLVAAEGTGIMLQLTLVTGNVHQCSLVVTNTSRPSGEEAKGVGTQRLPALPALLSHFLLPSLPVEAGYQARAGSQAMLGLHLEPEFTWFH